ncbi:MAG: hypothetical protein AABW73_02905 [Nanoarchaeota archaeon]
MVNRKRFISITQIIILLLQTFAFSYIIYSGTPSVSAQTPPVEDYTGNIGPQIGDLGVLPTNTNVDFQSSAALGLSCCTKMSNGAICQEGVAQGNEASCPSGWIPSRCNQVAECKIGCCVDSNSGICSPQSPKSSCEAEGGAWNNNQICNVDSCKKNCCVVGDKSYYVTEQECQVLSNDRGIQKKYVSVDNENSCLLLGGLQKKGACTYEQGVVDGEKLCKFGTKEECNKIKGVFSENLLCSNPLLNTTCKKLSKTSCVESLDGVYWFDSCGNRENIWEGNSQAQKDSAYNNGLVKTQANSCTYSSSNSQCGNCDRFSGSKCSVNTDGKAMCQSLNCAAAPASVGTKSRINGETWCVYESKLGSGDNVPGSSQFIYGCMEGKVISQSCGDYKNGICNEETIKGQSGTFSQASCRPNTAVECLQYNSQKTAAKKVKSCNENPDCSLEKFDFGTGYKFSVCLPKYPRGFDLNEEGGVKQAKVACKQADFTCTKVMEKKISGWSCVSGCDCDTQKFTDKMTDWCTSLGDCGPGVNTEGKVTTKGYKVVNAPKISQQKKNLISNLYKPKLGDFIKTDANFSARVLKDYYGIDASDPTDGGLGALTSLGSGIGVVGLLTYGATAILSTSVVGGTIPGFVSSGGASLGGTATLTTPLGTALASIGTVALGAGIGLAVGTIVAKVLGIQGQGATIIAVTGALVGTLLGIAAVSNVIPVIGQVIAIVIFIIVTALTKVLGIGDVEETKAVYTCRAWQPPKGGSDCEKCSKDPLKECTAYRCSALGKACEFINEGTEEEACVNIAPNDNTTPKITPWNEGLTTGYAYQNVDEYNTKIRTSSGECVPEMREINVGLKTDEPAQCAYSMKPTTSFDESEEQFNEAESYTLTHNITMMIPSAESVIYEVLGSLQNPQSVNIKLLEQTISQQYNNINYYVRCEDKAGNSDIKEYVVNTCVKPSEDKTQPIIKQTSPPTESNVAYNTENISVNFYLNEPATCKWSETEAKNYTTMENTMSCKTKVQDIGILGWECKTDMTGIKNSDKKFYVKCQDKPWLIGTNKESERNTMNQDFTYSVKTTKNKLNITKITPENKATIYGGEEPFAITLSAETAGGVDGGVAQCKYSFTQSGKYLEFYNTYSTSHKQEFSLMTKGNKVAYLECTDSSGNTASAQTSFTLELDTKAPVITRAYNSAGTLSITTDEDSECAYTTTSCNFDFNNASRMLGVTKTHTTSINNFDTYYIRCKDKYSNPRVGSECSMIIKTY